MMKGGGLSFSFLIKIYFQLLTNQLIVQLKIGYFCLSSVRLELPNPCCCKGISVSFYHSLLSCKLYLDVPIKLDRKCSKTIYFTVSFPYKLKFFVILKQNSSFRPFIEGTIIFKDCLKLSVIENYSNRILY